MATEEIKETAIEKVEPTTMIPQIIRPIVKPDEALQAWQEYQSLKDKLASEGDFVKIQAKQHPTKQFANKLSRFFGLSVSIIKADKEADADGFTWHIWARAMAPNGQFREGDGHCSSKERSFTHLEHDVYATAVTRAKNRAILELVGFGEVSAEEIVDGDSGHRGRGRTHGNGNAKTFIMRNDVGKEVRVTHFQALDWFGKAKKAVGDENYYELLGGLGYEHADEIPDEKMPAVFDSLVELWKARKKK